MKIRIHLTTGESFEFTQNNEVHINYIFDSLKKSKLFGRPQIIIHDSLRTNGFACERVDYVEFLTERKPDWNPVQELDRLVTLPKEVYEKNAQEICEKMEKSQISEQAGEKFSGLAEFIMRSGKRLFFEYEVSSFHRLDQRLLMQHFLESGEFLAEMQEGGYCIINSSNISRWVLTPGLSEAARISWTAEPPKRCDI